MVVVVWAITQMDMVASTVKTEWTWLNLGILSVKNMPNGPSAKLEVDNSLQQVLIFNPKLLVNYISGGYCGFNFVVIS